ncbi:response regulator [Longitalea arenae]|uniref:response regulator n=1 Tax=Longitalea arenae TaxID=2812558 RepID=UPI0019681176|nr:response regulator [Longitalea arenae]
MKTTKRILLIDDDEDDCFFFSTALEEFDSPVEFFFDRDSEVAIEKLRKDKDAVPDILFLDWNMPRMTGRQCLLAIRRILRYADLPIVIYTTSQTQADQDEAKRLGASYFLTKPATIGQLRKKLKDILSMDWKVSQT